MRRILISCRRWFLLNIVLAVVLGIVSGVERFFESESPLSFRAGEKDIMGRDLKELFVRTPIVPEIFYYDTCGPFVTLVYEEGTGYEGRHYPHRVISIHEGHVFTCLSP